MNRLPSSRENALRQPDWIEGEWITLADGQAWSFPRPADVPGHKESAAKAIRDVVDSVIPLFNVDGMNQQVQAYAARDQTAIMRGFLAIERIFAIYSTVFQMGAILLKRNYLVGDEDCEQLMPFNFRSDDAAELFNKIIKATPEVLAICNAVSKALGVDIGPELARISASN